MGSDDDLEALAARMHALMPPELRHLMGEAVLLPCEKCGGPRWWGRAKCPRCIRGPLPSDGALIQGFEQGLARDIMRRWKALALTPPRQITRGTPMSGRMRWNRVAEVVEKRTFVARAKERVPKTKVQPRRLETDRLAQISRRQMERHRKGSP